MRYIQNLSENVSLNRVLVTCIERHHTTPPVSKQAVVRTIAATFVVLRHTRLEMGQPIVSRLLDGLPPLIYNLVGMVHHLTDIPEATVRAIIEPCFRINMGFDASVRLMTFDYCEFVLHVCFSYMLRHNKRYLTKESWEAISAPLNPAFGYKYMIERLAVSAVMRACDRYRRREMEPGNRITSSRDVVIEILTRQLPASVPAEQALQWAADSGRMELSAHFCTVNER